MWPRGTDLQTFDLETVSSHVHQHVWHVGVRRDDMVV